MMACLAGNSTLRQALLGQFVNVRNLDMPLCLPPVPTLGGWIG
jgi:hypothetical protein